MNFLPKWAKKHEAVRLRFMAQRAASYGAAVLHKRLTMKHCSAKAPQYEASPFHSDMKHFAYAPYEFFAQMGKKT